jgi:branched-chain amino acid transport system permease protein
VIDALRDRWGELSRNTRVAAAVVVAAMVVAVVYNAPGSGDYLADHAPWGIVVSGVIIGTVTALLAMGLILIYRTNRFINFAYGAMGSFGGVIAIGLHKEQGWNFFAALPAGVAIGIVTGAAVDLVVRRFHSTSRLLMTVASIGIGQVLATLEFLITTHVQHFISLTGGFSIPLKWDIDLGVKTLHGDEILIMLVIPPILLALAWFLLRTDVGIAVRASAENADRALLLGIPIKRLSTIVWMIAGGLAALTFVLKAPFSGVTPGITTAGPVVLLPALAAAVVARMESLPIAFVAGVGIGVMEQVVRWNTSGNPTLQNGLFLVVILAALLLQRGKLSRAEESGASSWSATAVLKPIPDELRRLPEVLWLKRALGALAVLAFVLIPNTWSPSNQYTAAVAIIWAMTGVSLVILTGWGGHISLGQFAIVGVGALVAGNLVNNYNPDVFLVLAAAGAAGALISLLIGLPALRIRGLFLAVTTLAAAVALDKYVINVNNYASILPLDVEKPLLFERIDLNDRYNMYAFCLVFLGLSILVAQGVRKARAGRVIIATRDNQRAADASGVPTTSVKLAAFLLAGTISGVAGGLHVLLTSSVAEGSYQPTMSLDVFATAVIGGLGSVTGALSGVLVFRYLDTVTALGDIRMALTGGVLLVVLLAFPGGIGQLLYNVRDRYLRWIANRREILVPSLVADRRSGEKHAQDEVGLLQGALGEVEAASGNGHRPEPVGARS